MTRRRSLVLPALLALLVGASVLMEPQQSAQAAGSTLVAETFTGGSVADARFVPLGDACLTSAARPSTPPSGASRLGFCANTQGSPAPAPGSGWLQLTDVGFFRTGGVLFNQALPSSAGLEITFDQAQYGGTQADGISFFLSDGAFDLTATGGAGGSLGYAPFHAAPGVVGGFVGLGLDAFGNYAANTNGKAAACPAVSTAFQPNAVTLRGPGARNAAGGWYDGYCNLASTQLVRPAQDLRSSESSPRRVKVVVSPVEADGSVTIDAQISFDQGATYVELFTRSVPDAPATFKFGFSASTGGSTDVHLVRNLTVSTVEALDQLTIVKQEDQSSADLRQVYRVGDRIPYSFVVTNSGPAAITDVRISDPQIADVGCPSTTLTRAGAAGSSMTCTGSHTVVEADITSTAEPVAHVNTATASGMSAGVAVSATGQHVVTLGTAALRLDKDADRDDGLRAGDAVIYTFTATNAGSIPLGPIRVSDPGLGIVDAACVARLEPGQSSVCTTTGTRVITEADLLAGARYTNTATLSGALPPGMTPGLIAASDMETVATVEPVTALELDKTPSVATGATWGQSVGYTFSVRNTGSVTLGPVTVTDPGLGIADAPCATTLAPSATTTCTTTGAHVVTDADVLAGRYVNTATATGAPPAGSGLAPARADAQATVTTVPAGASLTLVKTADRTTELALGDTVTYTFTATNSGTVTLRDVEVDDPSAGLPRSRCVDELVPGASATCAVTATHTVTAADIAAGRIDNIATATAQPPAGSGLAAPSASASATVGPVPANASIAFTKAAVDGIEQAQMGDRVPFRFTVVNTGNVVLSPVMVTDERAGLTDAECVDELQPGQTATCATAAVVVVSEADLIAGAVRNEAVVSATPPGATKPTLSARSSASAPAEEAVASLEFEKTVSTSRAVEGDRVTFAFRVGNTGNLTLRAVTVTDPMLGLRDAPCVAVLEPGEKATCEATGTHVVEDPGTLVNRARVSATPPDGYAGPPVGATAEASVEVEPRPAGLAETGGSVAQALILGGLLLGVGLALRVHALRRRART